MAVLGDAGWQPTAHPCMGMLPSVLFCFCEIKDPTLFWCLQGRVAVLLRMSSSALLGCHWLLQFKTHKEKAVLHSVCLDHLADTQVMRRQKLGFHT